MRQGLRTVLGAVVVGLMCAGCLPWQGASIRVPAREAAKPPVTPALLSQGQRMYQRQCAVCHGASGAGDGPAAYLLYPKPRDFTQGEFRLVSTSLGQPTDEDLFAAITRGMPGSGMPSWEQLSAAERWALVYYVRTLTPFAAPAADTVIAVPAEAPRTPESLTRGQALFKEGCASCHGPLGRGDGPHLHIDNAGFPIKARDLTAGIMKGSADSEALYHRLTAGLPGSPMPSYLDAYTPEQIWDLVHYVQSLIPSDSEQRIAQRPLSLTAARVTGELPDDPAAAAWAALTPTYVALTPLWWRDERIAGVDVKASHNGQELAVWLAWDDPAPDDAVLTPQQFSDGAAVQLSVDKTPLFFGMGDAAGAVHIWHWKAAWQRSAETGRDLEAQYPHMAVDWYPGQRAYAPGEPFEAREAATSAQDPQLMSGWGAGNPLSDPQRPSGEEAMAKGLGTLTSRPPALQRVQAHGVWHDGRWQVVLRRPLADAGSDGLALKPGQRVSAAFAVWDGQAKDRNGQKSVSIWHTLELER